MFSKLIRSFKIALTLLRKGQFRDFGSKAVLRLQRMVGADNWDYEAWCARHAITDQYRQEMRTKIESMKYKPLISVLMPVYNCPEHYLRLAIESVQKQSYPHWELCIADDCSTSTHVSKVLKEFSAKDSRIKVFYRQTNGNISAATNSALELATGEFIALLDNDDELTEHAMFKVAECLNSDPTLDMFYSDEDKLTLSGKRIEPFFKPDWSPEYFLACMYTCHFGVYRASLVREIKGFRSEFDSAQDYDFVLRLTAKTARIKHIPDILYHWRMLPSSAASGVNAKPQAHDRAKDALQAHLANIGKRGTVEEGPSAGFHRVRFDILDNPKASIIIPTKGNHPSLSTCIESICKLSTWRNFEILIVGKDIPDGLDRRFKDCSIKHIPVTSEFNLAAMINLGAAQATGEHFVFMNENIEVISPDWIQGMLEFSQQDEIGAVGTRLLSPNERLQHAGVMMAAGEPNYLFSGFPKNHPGYFLNNNVHRNALAVSGACMMTRATVFRSVNGFSEIYPLYSDFDYCVKVFFSSKRLVYTPYAEFYNHQAPGIIGEKEQLRAFKELWAGRLPRDPYYNPNLSKQRADFSIDTCS